MTRIFLALCALLTLPLPAQKPKAPTGLSLSVLAVGDTVKVGFSWGPGARAVSYNVTRSVSLTNGSWLVVADSQAGGSKSSGALNLPNTFSYTATTLHHTMWLSAIPWDSLTVTVSVVSVNGAGVSSPVSASKRIVRSTPGPPGPVIFDSVVGTLVLPPASTVALGGSRIVCAFKQWQTGAVSEFTADKPSCDSIYTAYVPLANRSLVTAAQQAHTDSLGITCVTWASGSAAVQLTPKGSCSAAVLVFGSGLTRRFVADGLRYASR